MNKPPSTTIVIGAAGSIGGALTDILLESGGQVIRAVQTMDDFSDPNSETLEVDATSFDSVDKLFEAADSLKGPIDGVALCVGSILIKPAHLTREEDFERTMDLNLKSAFAVVRTASKRMMKAGGSIVLVSSCAALRGIPNHEAIAAAKAGVIGLTQSAAATYANRGIRVNCVAPGLTRSKMSAGIVNNEAALKASTAMHPLGRIGEPEEVASGIAWFLSPDQAWVTGQVLGIDGGLASLK
jgi:NAD(P)-dependent dehydrogenase (short-subunit alcohol dehydrogenase family)